MNYLTQEGATAVEYALMTGLVLVAIAGAVTTFGITVRSLFQSLLGSWPG